MCKTNKKEEYKLFEDLSGMEILAFLISDIYELNHESYLKHFILVFENINDKICEANHI